MDRDTLLKALDGAADCVRQVPEGSAEDLSVAFLHRRELATILAALRLWQVDVTQSENWPELPVDFGAIASDNDTVVPMDSAEIDKLCERLNQ